MTEFVARTCTEVFEGDSHAGPENSSRPLEEFRATDAYVLLGAPGAGKSEAFEHEAESQAGCYVTARDFRTFDDRPEWRGTTLYIDGLDETRVGSSDGCTPFDDIHAKLDRLGRPRFRLSCREADWFGLNDRDRLKAVSRDGKVTVLRLDPLSADDICEILRTKFCMADADGFIASARNRGIDALLANPLSLRMLASAVKESEGWPETRIQTFDMACRTLVRDPNPEHRIAIPDSFDISCLMDAAGRLCAIQLLAGRAGYALAGYESNPNFLELEQISGEDRTIFGRVLRSKLFEAPPQGPATPVHRQVAEFLAAKYLHGLIDNGLPVGRILALMTGHDGVIVSELRGLSAWLAAWNRSSRAEIIAREPLGTVLYGDARNFSVQEKTLVLEGLQRQAKSDRHVLQTVRMDARLGDLATPDMEDTFRAALTDPSREENQQIHVFSLISALRHGQAPPGIVDLMLSIVRDRHWYRAIRSAALRVFVRPGANTPSATAELDALLADVDTGLISDPDDDLLGTLLGEVYPARLSVPEALNYLRAPRSPSYFGNYYSFWTRMVPENSTTDQLAEFLDLTVVRFDRLRPVFVGSPGQIAPLRRVPLVWLTRFLERSQEGVPSDRLFNWLGVASDPELRSSGEEAGFLRRWLSFHPATIKDIVERSIERCSGSGNFGSCMGMAERRLFRAAWPADFGAWCLDKAVATQDRNAATWFIGRVAYCMHHGRQDAGLSIADVNRRLAGDADLLASFTDRMDALKGYDSTEADLVQERQTESRRKQRDWRRSVKQHEVALRKNRCQPPLLQQLAQVYFGEFVDVKGATPLERLHDLLGNDRSLIDAVLQGFRESIRRTDAPDVAEILRLRTRNQTHRLAFPIMAGLEETARAAAPWGGSLDKEEIRLALALHYTAPVPRGAGRPPSWFPPLLESDPEIVADVLVLSARSKMEGGNDFREDLYDLALSENHATVAGLAALPLLTSLPVRCTARQLPGLGILLQAALLYSEETALLELIDRKLVYRGMNVGQRVHWLAAGFLAAPDKFREALESYVAGNERRVRHLAAFAAGDDFPAALIGRLDVRMLRVLIRLIGSTYRPYSRVSQGTNDIARRVTASGRIPGFIDKLASIPTSAATRSLQDLLSDRNLRPWRSHLIDAAYRQNATRRDAEFRHCDIQRVTQALDNLSPANAADLAALTVDLLADISRNIRRGNTSDWRKYWNFNGHNRPFEPKPENACRDYLLHDLRHCMDRLDIDVQPEVRYANDKRSDIRVSHGGFNVPVEIKRSCHRNLWSAIGNQLISRYTPDPGTDGHGIYLVFWFGDTERCRPVAGQGSPPKSAADLEKRLRGTLGAAERLKISICVIDVSDLRHE